MLQNISEPGPLGWGEDKKDIGMILGGLKQFSAFQQFFCGPSLNPLSSTLHLESSLGSCSSKAVALGGLCHSGHGES